MTGTGVPRVGSHPRIFSLCAQLSPLLSSMCVLQSTPVMRLHAQQPPSKPVARSQPFAGRGLLPKSLPIRLGEADEVVPYAPPGPTAFASGRSHPGDPVTARCEVTAKGDVGAPVAVKIGAVDGFFLSLVAFDRDWSTLDKSALTTVVLVDVQVDLVWMAASDLGSLSTISFRNCFVQGGAGARPMRSVQRLSFAGCAYPVGAPPLVPSMWPSVRHLAVLHRSPRAAYLRERRRVEFDLHDKSIAAFAFQLRTLAAVPLLNLDNVEPVRCLRGLATNLEAVDQGLLRHLADDGTLVGQPVDFPLLATLRLLPAYEEQESEVGVSDHFRRAHRRIVRQLEAEENVERRRGRRKWPVSFGRGGDSSSDEDDTGADWRYQTVHFPGLTRLITAIVDNRTSTTRWSSAIEVAVGGWASPLGVLESVEMSLW